MAEDEKSKETRVEVLPKETDEVAELQRQTAVIKAVGEQFKAIVETPAVAGYLHGLSQAAADAVAATQLAQKNAHEFAMEREKNGAASRRRIEIMTAIWVPFLVLIAAASMFALVWMIHAELITRNDAVTLGVALTALYGLFAKKTADEKKQG